MKDRSYSLLKDESGGKIKVCNGQHGETIRCTFLHRAQPSFGRFQTLGCLLKQDV